MTLRRCSDTDRGGGGAAALPQLARHRRPMRSQPPQQPDPQQPQQQRPPPNARTLHAPCASLDCCTRGDRIRRRRSSRRRPPLDAPGPHPGSPPSLSELMRRTSTTRTVQVESAAAAITCAGSSNRDSTAAAPSCDRPRPTVAAAAAARRSGCSSFLLLALCLCSLVLCASALTMNFNPTRPSYNSLYTNQILSVRVSSSGRVGNGGVTLTISILAGGDGGTIGGGVLNFASSDSWSNYKTFTINAPPDAGSSVIRYAFSGSRAGSFTPIADQTVTWLAQHSIDFGPLLPAVRYPGETSSAITMTPSVAPSASVVITWSVTSGPATTMVFNPSSKTRTFSSGSTATQSFTLQQPLVSGTFVVSFVLSGTGEFMFATPAPLTVVVTAPVPFLFSVPFLTMLDEAYTGTAESRAVTLSEDVRSGRSVTMAIAYATTSGGGSVSPTSLAFNSLAPRSFVLTAPSVATATVTLTFTLSGTDAAHYIRPSPLVIAVRPKLVLGLHFDPPYSALTRFETLQPLLLEIVSPTPSANGALHDVSVAVNGVVAGSATPVFSYSPSLTTLAPPASLSASLSGWTSPASWTGAQTTLTVSFALSGPSAAAYATPSNVVFTLISTKSPFVLTYPLVMTMGGFVEVRVRPSVAPLSTGPGSGVTISFNSSTALQLTPTSLTFTSLDWTVAQFVRLFAPLELMLVNMSCTGLSGYDQYQFTVPAPISIQTGVGVLLTTAAVMPSVVYMGQAPLLLALAPTVAIPGASGGLQVHVDSLQFANAHYGTVSFPEGAAALTTESVWYTPDMPRALEVIRFSLNGSSGVFADWLAPLNVSFPIVPYPANSWGTPASPCGCLPAGGVCSSGYWGTGACRCNTGFTGALCNQCASGFYGPNCLPCACVYGTCNEGISGTGACSCQPFYSCSLCTCATSTRLTPYHVSLSGLEDQQLLVQFAASIASPLWGTTITSLPGAGSLFLTSDGVALTTQILAVPFSIASNQLQRVIYLPPAGLGAEPGVVFASFQYRVSSSLQNNNLNFATVSLFVKHVNRAPSILLHSTITGGDVLSTTGSMTGQQLVPLPLFLPAPDSATAFTIADSDAGPYDVLRLRLSTGAGNGRLSFNFPRTINPALLQTITPTPASLLSGYSFNASSLTILATVAELSDLVSWLVYLPSSVYQETDSISIEVNDLGATGVKAATGNPDPSGMESAASIALYLQRVNQPISIRMAANTSAVLSVAKENQEVRLAGALVDPDAFDAPAIRLHVSSAHGTISFGNANPPGLTSLIVSGRSVQINGTLAALNALLSDLIYTPDLYYFGPETIDLYANDMGFTGLGAPTEAALSLSFSLEFVDVPPSAVAQVVPMPEDGVGVRVTLLGASLDYVSSVTFQLTSLPDTRCMALFQWDDALMKRAGIITTSPRNLTDQTSNSLFAKMVPGSRLVLQATNGCPFTFETIKPSGPRSAPATVSFQLINMVNHAPIATALQLSVMEAADAVVALSAVDMDGDTSLSFWIAALPSFGTLFQVTPSGFNVLSVGSVITDVGTGLFDPGARVYYRSNTGLLGVGVAGSVSDSFSFGATDSLGASNELSIAAVSLTIVIDPSLPPLQCPHVTVQGTAGANMAVSLNLQPLSFTAVGDALTSVQIELAPLVGTLAQREYSTLGLIEPGTPFGLGHRIALDLAAPVSSQPDALVFVYAPPDFTAGAPLAFFNYSCTDLAGHQSSSDHWGMVSLLIHAVNQAPTIPSSIVFRNVSFSAGLQQFSLLSNVTDADSAASSLVVKIVRLPVYGNLYRNDGTQITAPSLPSMVATSNLTYIPFASTEPRYDSFLWSAFDGQLSSSVGSVFLVVGAFSMPSKIVASNPAQAASAFTYEGGLPMRLELRYNISDPKLLSKPVRVFVGDMPHFGQLSNANGDLAAVGDSVIDAQALYQLSLFYIPPVLKPTNVDRDNFTLYVVDSLDVRSLTPDLFVSVGLQKLNQLPRAGPSYDVGVQDSPTLMELNATSFGAVADRYARIMAPFPNALTQGALYHCRADGWLNYGPADLIDVSDANHKIPAGCNGVAGAVGIVFVPVPYFHTMASLAEGGARTFPAVQISYVLHDGLFLASPTAVATLDLTHVIYPPTATPAVGVSLRENDAVVLSLSGIDHDGNTLSATISSLPGSGGLFQFALSAALASAGFTAAGSGVNTAGAVFSSAEAFACQGALIDPISAPFVSDSLRRVVYIPDAYYSGTDSFAFAVFHGLFFSPVVSQPLLVTPMQYPPFWTSADAHWTAMRLDVAQSVPRLLNLTALQAYTDPEGGHALQFVVTVLPTLGFLYQIPDAAVITPAMAATQSVPYSMINPALAITTVPSNVTNSRGLLAFAPQSVDDLGPAGFADYLYASFNYSLFNGFASSAFQLQSNLHVVPVYTLPTAPGRVQASNFSMFTWENQPVVVELTGWVDDLFTSGNYTALIVGQPNRGGIVCQYAQVPGAVVEIVSTTLVLQGVKTTVLSSPQAPCGLDYGVEVTGTVQDPGRTDGFNPPRVVFLPGLNIWGDAAHEFSYSIQDSRGGRSEPCAVLVNVGFINQPPTIPTALPFVAKYIIAAEDFPVGMEPDLNAAPALLIELPASDPEGVTMTFELLDYPTAGVMSQLPLAVYTSPSQRINEPCTGCPLGSALFPGFSADPAADFEAVQDLLPLPLLSPFLLYHPANTGGGTNPFQVLRYSATDNEGLNATGTITLTLSCGLTLFPNVWVVGVNKGAACLPCPVGASCSAFGSFKPFSQQGYWRSEFLDARGGPIYIRCVVESSCLATHWEDQGLMVGDIELTAIEAALYQSNTSTMLDAQEAYAFGCADGFGGRMCAGCRPGYSVQGSSCVPCPSGSASASALSVFLMFMEMAIPVLVVGLAVFWVIKIRMKVDTSFFGIAISFLQTVASFRVFKLRWPNSNAAIFDSLSFISINLDLLSLECSIPDIEFTSKWLAFMMLPLVAGALLLVAALLGTAVIVGVQWGRGVVKARKKDAARKKYELSAAAAAKDPANDGTPEAEQPPQHLAIRLPKDDPLSDPVAAAAAATAAASARHSPSFTHHTPGAFSQQHQKKVPKDLHDPNRLQLWVLLCKWTPKLSAQAFSLFILFLDFIYLPLCIMCLNMLACTRLDDGTLSLDYAPALRCDEPWWGFWSKVAILFLMLYGVGIPLFYSWVFFVARPQVHSYPMRVPPFSWIRPGCFCPRAWMKRSWKEDMLVDVRSRTAPHPDKTLAAAIALQNWERLFKEIVEPFSTDQSFWQLLIIARSFGISVVAVFMQQTPMYQAVLCLLILFVALVIQLAYLPYKFHKYYNLNRLENVNLMALMCILTCGIIFLLSAPGTNGSTHLEHRYPGFRTLMEVGIYALMMLVCYLSAEIFMSQVKLRLKYNRRWQHSRWRHEWIRIESIVARTKWMRVFTCRDPWPAFNLTLRPLSHEEIIMRALAGSVAIAAASALTTQHQQKHKGSINGSQTAAGGGHTERAHETSVAAPTLTDTPQHQQHHHPQQHSVPKLPLPPLAPILSAKGRKHVTLDLPADSDDSITSTQPADSTGRTVQPTTATATTRADRPTHAHKHSGVSFFNNSQHSRVTSRTMGGDLEMFAASSANANNNFLTPSHNKLDPLSSPSGTARTDPNAQLLAAPSSHTAREGQSPSPDPNRQTPDGSVDGSKTDRPLHAHNRLRSVVWQPPRISDASPLAGLDSRALYTHARYVSLDNGTFSLRQIREINAGDTAQKDWEMKGLFADDEEDNDLNTPVAGDADWRATPTPGLTPSHAGQLATARGDTPLGHHLRRSPAPGEGPRADTPVMDESHPLKHVKVMIGRPSYSRWFKPPPPAGLFAKRAALLGSQAAMLARLMRMGSHEGVGDGSDNDSAEPSRSGARTPAADPTADKSADDVAAAARLASVRATLGLLKKGDGRDPTARNLPNVPKSIKSPSAKKSNAVRRSSVGPSVEQTIKHAAALLNSRKQNEEMEAAAAVLKPHPRRAPAPNTKIVATKLRPSPVHKPSPPPQTKGAAAAAKAATSAAAAAGAAATPQSTAPKGPSLPATLASRRPAAPNGLSVTTKVLSAFNTLSASNARKTGKSPGGSRKNSVMTPTSASPAPKGSPMVRAATPPPHPHSKPPPQLRTSDTPVGTPGRTSPVTSHIAATAIYGSPAAHSPSPVQTGRASPRLPTLKPPAKIKVPSKKKPAGAGAAAGDATAPLDVPSPGLGPAGRPPLSPSPPVHAAPAASSPAGATPISNRSASPLPAAPSRPTSATLKPTATRPPGPKPPASPSAGPAAATSPPSKPPVSPAAPAAVPSSRALPSPPAVIAAGAKGPVVPRIAIGGGAPKSSLEPRKSLSPSARQQAGLSGLEAPTPLASPSYSSQPVSVAAVTVHSTPQPSPGLFALRGSLSSSPSPPGTASGQAKGHPYRGPDSIDLSPPKHPSLAALSAMGLGSIGSVSRAITSDSEDDGELTELTLGRGIDSASARPTARTQRLVVTSSAQSSPIASPSAAAASAPSSSSSMAPPPPPSFARHPSAVSKHVPVHLTSVAGGPIPGSRSNSRPTSRVPSPTTLPTKPPTNSAQAQRK